MRQRERVNLYIRINGPNGRRFYAAPDLRRQRTAIINGKSKLHVRVGRKAKQRRSPVVTSRRLGSTSSSHSEMTAVIPAGLAAARRSASLIPPRNNREQILDIGINPPCLH